SADAMSKPVRLAREARAELHEARDGAGIGGPRITRGLANVMPPPLQARQRLHDAFGRTCPARRTAARAPRRAGAPCPRGQLRSSTYVAEGGRRDRGLPSRGGDVTKRQPKPTRALVPAGKLARTTERRSLGRVRSDETLFPVAPPVAELPSGYAATLRDLKQ